MWNWKWKRKVSSDDIWSKIIKELEEDGEVSVCSQNSGYLCNFCCVSYKILSLFFFAPLAFFCLHCKLRFRESEGGRQRGRQLKAEGLCHLLDNRQSHAAHPPPPRIDKHLNPTYALFPIFFSFLPTTITWSHIYLWEMLKTLNSRDFLRTNYSSFSVFDMIFVPIL